MILFKDWKRVGNKKKHKRRKKKSKICTLQRLNLTYKHILSVKQLKITSHHVCQLVLHEQTVTGSVWAVPLMERTCLFPTTAYYCQIKQTGNAQWNSFGAHRCCSSFRAKSSESADKDHLLNINAKTKNSEALEITVQAVETTCNALNESIKDF